MIGRETPLRQARFIEAKTTLVIRGEKKRISQLPAYDVTDVHLTRSPLGRPQPCAEGVGYRRVPSVAVQLFRDSRDADASSLRVDLLRVDLSENDQLEFKAIYSFLLAILEKHAVGEVLSSYFASLRGEKGTRELSASRVYKVRHRNEETGVPRGPKVP